MKTCELLAILVGIAAVWSQLVPTYTAVQQRSNRRKQVLSFTILIGFIALGFWVFHDKNEEVALATSALKQKEQQFNHELAMSRERTHDQIISGLEKILHDALIREEGEIENDELWIQSSDTSVLIDSLKSINGHGRVLMDTFDSCNTLYRHMLTTIPHHPRLEELLKICEQGRESICKPLISASTDKDLNSLKRQTVDQLREIGTKLLAESEK